MRLRREAGYGGPVNGRLPLPAIARLALAVVLGAAIGAVTGTLTETPLDILAGSASTATAFLVS
jgi:hypothetical protein